MFLKVNINDLNVIMKVVCVHGKHLLKILFQLKLIQTLHPCVRSTEL